MKKIITLFFAVFFACSMKAQTVDLSTYVRVGRYDLPEPTRTTPPVNSLLAQEVSAVTYNWDTQTLFVVGDGGTSVVQVSKTGQLINSMTLAPGSSPQGGDFYDPEGLIYIGNGQFVMSEERDRQAVLFTYVAGGTLTRSAAQTVKLGTFVQNIGLEGLSFDPLTGGYIFVKETQPQGIFQTGIDFIAGTATNGSPTTENSINLFDPALANLLDFADVFALSNLPALIGQPNYGNLLVLSQESGKIINIDRSGNISSSLTIVSDPGNPLTVSAQQHEGLTMDRDGNIYVVSENGGGDFDHPQLWVYAPASAANLAPTAISLSNVISSIAENTGTLSPVKVADILVTDDGQGTNNLTISGADASFFQITGAALYIKAGTVLDFETKASYSITVNVDDVSVGNTPDAATNYTLSVTDVLVENPPVATLTISEVAPWGSGNSPVAADWFEVTNNGTAAINITGWKMDDNSNAFATSVALNGITSIAPGESVIFLETAVPATTIASFLSTWFGANPPAGLQVGSYTGSGVGLSTGGDAVNLFDASGALQAKITFGTSPAGPSFPTFNNAAGLNNTAVSQLSIVGVNSAFAAVNDAAEIGSPGTVGKILITEVAPWSSGNSPVGADWFEVTNTRAVAADITGWKVDDNSGSFAAALALNGITTIAPGESVIFMESATPATTIPLFLNTWFGPTPPTALKVGTYTGSGIGLGTGGDAVNLYNSTGALQASVIFGASSAAPYKTFDNAAGLNNTTISQLSQAGINGAFIAKNDANEIGSPGTIVNIICSTITVSASAPLIPCPGGTTTVTVNAAGGILPYAVSGNPLTVGAGTYIYTVTDAKGCTGTASITIAVGTDAILPTITAPGSVTVSSNDGCGASGVNLGTAVTADNCSVASVINNAPATFPVGATTVTWTVTDGSGNTATATQSITVTDTLKPVVYLQGSSLLTGITGASSSQSPYLKPFKPGTQFKSILTVGDAVGGYKMAGIPDGLGAFDNGNGTFTLLMNHEINNTLGVPRAHGAIGTFVSKWVINKSDLSVVSGSDLMQQLYLWDTTTKTYNLGTLALSRFCSADLPAVSAFYNNASGKGTKERIFMNGEESGAEGRAVGHIVTGANAGKSYELPALGKFAWENSVASPATGDKTVVAGMDDGTGGQVYIYIGTKTSSGTDIDKAGLNNGKLYGVKVAGLLTEVSTGIPAAGTHFDLADLGFVQNKTGAVLNTESVTAGVTTFLRPEDGAWDPSNPNDFYFVTTNSFTAPTRLWRLRFDNINTPETGGTIEAVLDGTEPAGQHMYDNIAVDKKGHVFIQEDPGNQSYIARIWQYNIATDSLFPIAYHDSTRFINGAANYLTQDEESSGITDVSDILGQGMYLMDVQAHYGIAGELVEGGQLLAMYHPASFGTSTAPDTIRVTVPFGTTSATVNLGTPSTADNCSVASVTNNAASTFPLGTTTVTWTATDASGNIGTANQVVIVTGAGNTAPSVSITSPVSPATYGAGSTITVDVAAADTDGAVSKVEIFVNGNLFATDSVAPYTFTGTQVDGGLYKVTAKATDNFGAFTVSDTLVLNVAECTPSGSITGEGYTNILGSQVADLLASPDYPNSPSINASLTSLEYVNVADNYGGRLRGYICAPVTGDYTFYISGDDQAGLWLGTTDNPASKVLIAYTEAATFVRQYYKNASQKSVKIHLVKGGRYYIETLQKESAGADHVSVAWVLPGGVLEAPIPGSRLSPYTLTLGGRPAPDFTTAMRTMQQTMEAAKELMVRVQPNPSQNEFTLITRSNSEQDLTISVMDAQGRVVETVKGASANGAVQIGRKLIPGIYFAEVLQGKQKKMLKLIKQ